MTAHTFVRATLLASALALATPVFAASPTMHDVYVAAEAGKYAEAQTMMDSVLREHPNSAKAHFVEAELLAKQGKMREAAASLATADKLAPGLPFAKPGVADRLRTLINSAAPAAAVAPAPVTAPARNGNEQARPNYSQQNAGAPARVSDSGIPWGMILGGVALVGFIVWASRFMQARAARTQQQQMYGGQNDGGYGPGGYPQQGYPQQGYGPGQGGMMQGGMQPQGSGLGSRIAGGLATGAAIGAGMVAGEALARSFGGSHGDSNHADNSGNNNSGNNGGTRNDIVYDQPASDERLRGDDMGGTDFGVSDTSWDSGGGDSGGGGGDDWN